MSSETPEKDFDARLDALLYQFFNKTLNRAGPLSAIFAAVVLLVSLGEVALVGELSLQGPIVAFAGLLLGLLTGYLAWHERINRRTFFAIWLVGSSLPLLRTVIAMWWDPLAPAREAFSPDVWFWFLCVVLCGITLDRVIVLSVAALCAVQSVIAFYLARPVLLTLEGPEPIIDILTSPAIAGVRVTMLLLLGVAVAYFSTVLRRLVGRILIEEQRARREEVGREKAERISEAKSAFLANMNHELRTPLNAVLGYAQILLRREDLDSAHRDGLITIRESGEHLGSLLEDVLDMSKIEAERLELEPGPTHLLGLLDGIKALFAGRIEGRALSLEVERDEAVPVWVEVDEKRLRQVLLNLAGNAVKFTERGKVVLRVRRLGEHGGVARVRFEVEDTGPGISEDQFGLIFEPFEQVGDRAMRAQGTGLGLSISKRLVALMGGEIDVKSEPGEGSLFGFEIDLPSTEARPGERPSESITGYEGTRRRILVVDDRRLNRMVLLEMLEPLGFEVVLAESGVQAVESCRQTSPDLILTDLIMPEMNGFEAAAVIRDLPGLAEVPIVAVTASAVSMAKNTQDRLFDAVMHKPVAFDLLRDTLEEQLSLTWTVVDSAREVEQSAEASENDGPVEVPPEEVLTELIGLAVAGDMMEVEARTGALVAEDGRYEAFGRQVTRLSESFDDKGLVDLLQHLLVGGGAKMRSTEGP